jgi:protein-L-isoaspartate(D-aspartate) O-methyltransferase
MISELSLKKAHKLALDCEKHFPMSQKVKDAIANTPRELFVPKGFGGLAYKIDALPIAGSQWISSPLTVAKMTEYLIPMGVDKVLEIGCGSGYQAAVLSHLFRGVFTIERIEKLVLEAKSRFRELAYHNVHVRCDDGQNGWIQYAPYDRILYSATAQEIPQKIFNQLSSKNGVLVAPMKVKDKQIITRFYKDGDFIEKEELEECDFVPVLNGVQKI